MQLYFAKKQKNARQQNIALKSTNYLISNFKSAIVVFDGYPETSTTKDNPHKRSVGKATFLRTEFEPDILFQAKKDVFLSNSTNKQLIMNVASNKLQKGRCYVFHSHDDADVGIVRAAVQSSLEFSASIIGGNTDLLLLFLYHADVNSKLFYFKSSKQSNKMEIHNFFAL